MIRNVEANTGRFPNNALTGLVSGVFFFLLSVFMFSVAKEAWGILLGVAFLAVGVFSLLTGLRYYRMTR
jgi:hypothetical protein